MKFNTAQNLAFAIMWILVMAVTYFVGTRFGFSLRTDMWLMPYLYMLVLWGSFFTFYSKILDKITNFLTKTY